MFLGRDKDEWLVRRRDICDCSTVCLQTWWVLRSMCAAIFREKEGLNSLPAVLAHVFEVISASLHLKCSIMACLGSSDIPTVRSPVPLVTSLTKSLEAIAPMVARTRHHGLQGQLWWVQGENFRLVHRHDISPRAVANSARCVPRGTFHALVPR